MSLKEAITRLVEGRTKDDRRLRAAILISAVMLGVWLGQMVIGR